MTQPEKKLGLDYSWARPGGAAIAAAGFQFVMRYVPYRGDGGKGLTLAELNDLRTNGLEVGLVFESTAGRMFDGYPAGAYDAQVALDSARLLGWPEDLPIYFACDLDTTSDGQRDLIDDYFAGVHTVLPLIRTGEYGEYEVVEHCHANGLTAYHWQTYAWSGANRHPYRHLLQWRNSQMLNGGEVDYNEAYGTDQGLWRVTVPDEPTPSPTPPTPPTPAYDPTAELNAAMMKRENLRAVASGDYDTLCRAWDLLKSNGII